MRKKDRRERHERRQNVWEVGVWVRRVMGGKGIEIKDWRNKKTWRRARVIDLI
jgi:hypothetical protein